MKAAAYNVLVFFILSVAAIQPGLAQNQVQATPAPFKATYSLVIKGWPDARIHHRLSHQGALWQSEMSASIATAKGDELSRFRLAGNDVNAQFYSSGYRFLGFGERYELDANELSHLPDRQTALFILSRAAKNARCTHSQVAPCRFSFLNHKGEEKLLKYRVVKHDQVTVPAGTFPRVVVDVWDPEERDRHMFIGFHSDMPGLLLSFEYQREGERKSHLTLSRLALGNSASQ
ncbi:hypothetical protein [Halomonas sp. PR-M31]|uniref:hypothetical protein n=1 Tax=Halomonas sp. PR-M31 TaxID=1471202 RepID=UPI00065207EF|nr:hypothetical protein [Halomonas sp. PR-M31]